MASILLTQACPAEFTMVSNLFIDDYMPHAHGDYVKIYLYLLRCLQTTQTDISISSLADRFENTEKDILRALQYWEQKKLISMERRQEEICEISILNPKAIKLSNTEKPLKTPISDHTDNTAVTPPDTAPLPPLIPRPVYTAEQITCLKEDPQVTTLLHQIEQTLKRLLKPNDIQLILYLYESIGFPPNLILYLYEYCISIGKTHSKYIEQTAVNWHRKQIRTIEQAQMTTTQYRKEYYTIARALGFQRTLADIECDYVDKWLRQWKLPLDVILEACSRTILQTQTASFTYIDKILKAWHNDNVHSLEDVKKLDDAFNREASVKNMKKPALTSNPKASSQNRFTSFEQHRYSSDDMDIMEKAMLQNSQKKIRN